MDELSDALLTYGWAALWVAIGAVAGLVVERLVVRPVQARSRERGSGAAEAVAFAIGRTLPLWGALVGWWLAIARMDLPADVEPALWKALRVAGIATATWLLARLSGRLVRWYARRGDTPIPASSIFVNITRAVVWVVGLLTVLATLGVSIAPLLTALGVGGLAVALAAQETLSNLFAGLQIIASRQIRPGDFIRLSTGEEGHVLDVTWRNTSIRQISNDVVIVPNSVIGSSLVTNYSTIQPEHSVVVDVGVAYDSDLERVERVTRETALAVVGGSDAAVPEFEPVVRFTHFGDSSIGVRAVLRARAYTDRFQLQHEFVKALHRRYAEEGIVIPFPIRTVHLERTAAEES